MSKLKTKVFSSSRVLGGIREYQEFIRENPYIEVINTMLTKHNTVILTYKEQKDGKI